MDGGRRLRSFCPSCWTQLDDEFPICPVCGYNLAAHSALPYEEKLLLALNHPVRDHRMMAIETLGRLKSRRAIPALGRLLDTERDYYTVREALSALARIGTPASMALVRRATQHPSPLVRRVARDLLAGPAGDDSSRH